jgi:hypothetical protein
MTECALPNRMGILGSTQSVVSAWLRPLAEVNVASDRPIGDCSKLHHPLC